MRTIDNNTFLNSIIKDLDKRLGSSLPSSLITAQVIDSIQDSRKKPTLATKSVCQFPFSKRNDEYNTSTGLGSLSLQPAIDSLNNFKQTCIKDIKTKIQAMAPEGTRQQTLMGGVVEVISEVLKAAICFTQTLTSLNNLLSKYIYVTSTYVASNIS